MSNNNGTLQGSVVSKISIAKLSQSAGKVVALGLTIADSKFTRARSGVYQEVYLFGYRQHKADMHVKGFDVNNIWFEM